MTEKQTSIFELMQQEEKKITPPEVREGEAVYRIPQGVWETRCRICVHRRGKENIPMPKSEIWKYKYEEIIPCRIMGISQYTAMAGECLSFAPSPKAWGICATCRHNGAEFTPGFCFKENHAEQRRVYFGTHYGGDERKKDYWGRHRLSTCDDYEPDCFAEKEE